MSRCAKLSRAIKEKGAYRTPKVESDINQTELNHVKDKLRKLPDYKEKDEEELTVKAEELIDPEKLKLQFSHLLHTEVGDAVWGTCGDVDAFPEGEFVTSLEHRMTQARVEDRYTKVAKLPLYLYLSELSEGRKVVQAAKGSLGFTFASLLGFEYGAHHAALLVGNVILEWDDSCLVIPKQVEASSPVFKVNIQRFSHWSSYAAEKRSAMSEAAGEQMDFPRQIELMVEVNTEKNKLIDDLVSVIVRYNKCYGYNFMLRNCQHFVLDAMHALKILRPPTFNGKLKEYFHKLKKGLRKNIPCEFNSHEDLDEYVKEKIGHLKQEDLEYYLCLFFGFHLKAGMKDLCPVPSCQMERVEGQLDKRSVLLYKLFPQRTQLPSTAA